MLVLAATEVQLAEPGPVVLLCHQAAAQLDRFSVAVVCATGVAVNPTVENSASVESVVISVVQALLLYAL